MPKNKNSGNKNTQSHSTKKQGVDSDFALLDEAIGNNRAQMMKSMDERHADERHVMEERHADERRSFEQKQGQGQHLKTQLESDHAAQKKELEKKHKTEKVNLEKGILPDLNQNKEAEAKASKNKKMEFRGRSQDMQMRHITSMIMDKAQSLSDRPTERNKRILKATDSFLSKMDPEAATQDMIQQMQEVEARKTRSGAAGGVIL